MDKEIRERLEIIINLLGQCCGSLDYAFEQFVSLSEALPKENQMKVKESIELLLEHIEASCKDTRL